MKIEMKPLTASHVRNIVKRNLANGTPDSAGIPVEEMIQAYFSPGSASYCLTADGTPVFAAGIINFGWHRGEAWLLTSSLFFAHTKTAFRTIKRMLPEVAAACGFKRVQAVCWDGSKVLFEHLGFTQEGTLKRYGPVGQDCLMYARLF